MQAGVESKTTHQQLVSGPLFTGKKKISPSIQAQIIKDCIDEEKGKLDPEGYSCQKKALGRIFKAVENGEELSLDFILELNELFTHTSREDNPYMDPSMSKIGLRYDRAVVQQAHHGFTKEGIQEILTIVANEKENKLPHKETCLGPQSNGSCQRDVSYRQDTLPQDWEEKLVDKIYEDSRTKPYAYEAPIANTQGVRHTNFLTTTLQDYIKQFNQAINSPEFSSGEDKKKLINEFVKKCLRLHPVREGNHRLFVLGVMNFLLLRHLNMYCSSSNRRQFMFNGKSESLLALNAALKEIVLSATSDVEPLPEHHISVISSSRTPLLHNQPNELEQQVPSSWSCPCVVL